MGGGTSSRHRPAGAPPAAPACRERPPAPPRRLPPARLSPRPPHRLPNLCGALQNIFTKSGNRGSSSELTTGPEVHRPFSDILMRTKFVHVHSVFFVNVFWFSRVSSFADPIQTSCPLSGKPGCPQPSPCRQSTPRCPRSGPCASHPAPGSPGRVCPWEAFCVLFVSRALSLDQSQEGTWEVHFFFLLCFEVNF